MAPHHTGGPVTVALVGAGTISDEYLSTLTRFPDIRVLAVTDLDERAAAARARAYGVPESGDPGLALEHPDIELIVNLTPPAAHVRVAGEAVAAGKHVWSEKPFSLDRSSGEKLLTQANNAGVRLGSAPDTFLGAGLQTARRVIERGDIGEPLTALTLMQSPGPDQWHPNPDFLFDTGAGPLFDIGPYYLTTLVHTLGEVAQVSAMGSTARSFRTVKTGPRAGEEFPVNVPTHVSALLRFAGGPVASSVYSFDSPLPRKGFVEITGTMATIAVPDPNRFDGEVRLYEHGSSEWVSIPAVGAEAGRGVGVLELARAIAEGREHRATGERAFHVVDTMVAITEAVESGTTVEVASSTTAPAPLPQDWDPYVRTIV